jgi:hypothetical protein
VIRGGESVPDERELREALSDMAASARGIPADEREEWREAAEVWAAQRTIPGAPPYAALAGIFLDLAAVVWGVPDWSSTSDA